MEQVVNPGSSSNASMQVAHLAVKQLSHIATLPEVTLGIIELVENPQSSARDLNALIGRDPALSARILKVVGAGQTLPVAHVKGQLRAQGFDEGVINTALRVMDSREEVKLVDERKMVRRHK
jgi:hypothetical protein